MRDRVAWAVVLVPVALLTLPGLFVGRAPLEGDLLVYQLPIYEVLSDAVRAGQLPWWDPTVQSGTPFFANVQTQLLWPATWLHAVLPHGPALLIWLLLHGLLAAVGARLWLRGRDLSQSAATLGALVFTLGGPALSMVTKPDKLPAFALVPWLLWGVDRWARGDRVRAAAVVVAAQVGMALSGGLEIWILALLGVLVFEMCERPPQGREVFVRAATFAAAVGLAFALAAVQLIPFLHLMAETTRSSGIEYGALSKWSLRVQDLPGLLIPWWTFLGDPPVRFLANLGVGTPAAVAFVAWMIPRDGRPRGPSGETFAVAYGIVLFLLLALGDATPVHRWVSSIVPGLDSMRYPEKYVWGAWPFLVLAVARGWERLPTLGGGATVGVLVVAALELCVLARVLLPPVDVSEVLARAGARDEPVPRYFNVDRHLDKRTPLPPRESAQQRLVDVSDRAWPNVGVIRDGDGRRRFEYADGVRAIRLERQDLYFDHVAPQPVPNALLLLRRAGVGALGFLSPERHDEWTSAAGVASTWQAPHTVVEVPGFRRVGWARSAERATDDGAAFRALGGPDLLEARRVVIEPDGPGSEEALKEEHPAPDVAPPDLVVERPSPDTFVIDVPAVGGWLVVREAWAPGWRAEVERGGSVRPLPLARADFYLQAVPVPFVEGGETVRIRLSYRPSGLGTGLIVSILGLLSFLAALGGLKRR